MRKPNHVPNVSEIFTASGSRKKPIYTPRFDGECILLRETGSIDIQDSINSYAPYCDLRYMLTRLKAGDTSVLSSRPASYGDLQKIEDQNTFDNTSGFTKSTVTINGVAYNVYQSGSATLNGFKYTFKFV